MTTTAYTKYCLTISLLLGTLLLSFSPLLAATDDEVRVTIGPDESLRELSGRLLGKKDAWTLILLYNGFNNVEEVPADTALLVPVKVFTTLNKRLDRCATLISEANSEGAAMLAAKEIARAVQLRDQAMSLKKEARFVEAADIATQATGLAKTALRLSKSGKIRSVEAWLSAKSGTVQNRPPDQSRWHETDLRQKLVERERVRTLAASRGKVNFSDHSHLILGERSLAIIGSMKENVVRKSYDTSVSVVEGDIQFHLASLNQRKKFKVTSPGVVTAIRSTNFRTSRDQANVTRIANYDGEIDIKSQGIVVTIKKNQASKIVPGRKPSQPKNLLPPPQMLSPKPDQPLTSAKILFTWQPVDDALRYRIEISNTQDFTRLLATGVVSGERFHWKAPSSGVFTYRIHTVDKDKQTGPYSEPFGLFVDIDDLPPFLVLRHPAKDMLLTEEVIEVRGEVEQGATLHINNQPVTPADDGSFSHSLRVDETGVVTVRAVDGAGNISQVERKLTLDRDSKLIRLTVPATIITNTSPVAVSGSLQPGTRVEINDKPVSLAEQFTHLFHLDEGEHQISLKGTGANNRTEQLQLRIIVDLTPPEINVDELARTTAAEQVTISGSVVGAATLTLNGAELPVTNDEFSEIVFPVEGSNEFLLVADDRAGNRASWTSRILRDSQPPEIIKQQVMPATVKSGGIVRLIVEVNDAGVGAAGIGSFTLAVRERKFKGILKKINKDGSFAGSLFIPPGVSGAVQVEQIRLKDMLGNETI